MNTQIMLAIVVITVIVSLTSVILYSTNSDQQYTLTDSPKLQVISSFNPLHEFSQIVGGDKIDARLLIPAGVEPHDWEPTIKDVQEIQKSDLIIINGIGFENWIDNLAENNYQGTIVDTSNGIFINNLDQENITDPHIWLNPLYAKKQVQNIAQAFSNHDPENGEFYHTNAAQYGKQLDLLDSKISTELSDCNDDFIAFHDAFSYFAKEYGLNQHAIVSSNASHGEATAKTLENVITKARELNIKIIFSEESINTKTLQVIADEIGGKVLVLSTLEIVSDGDYISKMNQNLEHLKEALC